MCHFQCVLACFSVTFASPTVFRGFGLYMPPLAEFVTFGVFCCVLAHFPIIFQCFSVTFSFWPLRPPQLLAPSAAAPCGPFSCWHLRPPQLLTPAHPSAPGPFSNLTASRRVEGVTQAAAPLGCRPLHCWPPQLLAPSAAGTCGPLSCWSLQQPDSLAKR